MIWRRLLPFGLLCGATASLFAVLSSDDPSGHLVFATWGTPTEVASFQRLIDHYNATRRPPHTVKLSHIEQNSYTEHLLVQAAAQSLPDVIHLDRKDVPMFVHRGLLEDLTPRIEADTGFSLEAFLPALLPGCQVAGRFYGIPNNFSTLVLYFNKDQFDAEGLPYPDSSWTWETFLHAARRLTKRDAAGTIVRYGCFLHVIRFTLIQQFGGRILNSGMDSCIIASPEAAAALQWDINLAGADGVTWSVLSQNLNWDDMFAGGRCAMIANGRWAAAWYLQSMPEGALDVAPLPRGRRRMGASVNHLMTVSAQSTKKNEAWEFATFLASDTAQRMINEDGANIPALRAIVYSDAFLHHPSTPGMHNEVFLEGLASSAIWPAVQGPYLTGYELLSQLDLAMRRIQLGQASPIQSLRIMQDNLNTVIARQRQRPEPERFIESLLFYLSSGLLFLAVCVWILRRRRHLHGS
jgi:multiple sugar transport system substrate-binding protein